MNPGIIHAQERVDGKERDVYIVVEIDGILYNSNSGLDTASGAAEAARDDANKAAYDAHDAAHDAYDARDDAAYAAVKVAKKMADGNGLDPEAKLKIAHTAYRIAQFAWQYDTDVGDKKDKADACKTRANALKNMIDACYEDKVGDIEAQANAVKAQS